MKKLLVGAVALSLLVPTATVSAQTLEEQLKGSQAAGNSEAFKPVQSKGTEAAPVVNEKPVLSIDNNNDLHKVRLSENGEAKFNELGNTSVDLTPKAPEASATTAAATSSVAKPGATKPGATKPGTSKAVASAKAKAAAKAKSGAKALPKTSAVK